MSFRPWIPLLAYNFKRSPLNVEGEDYDKRGKVTSTFFYSPIHETYNPYFISCLIESDCESLQSELEEALGPAYGQQFAKRGEAADRLRNILNKYKQGSNCKYDSILCIINDSCLAWLIFRYHECTYLNNWLVRNSDEVSHVFPKWVIGNANANEFHSSCDFTKRSRYFGFYWKDNLENA